MSGGDVLSVQVAGADADSIVWVKLVAPAEDQTRHCTGFHGIRFAESGTMVFNKELTINSSSTASIDWFIPNIDYSADASYAILVTVDGLVSTAPKGGIDNDRTGCSRPLWAASSLFNVAFQPMLPTITGDFGPGKAGERPHWSTFLNVLGYTDGMPRPLIQDGRAP